ncbi:MAG: glycosyltransferase family 4 protein [Flavobacteriaceae bacterium]
MSKNIWIINQYLTTPELNGDGYRHYYLAKEFEKKGFDTTLITSSFSHVPSKDIRFKGFFKIFDNEVRTLVIKGNRFVHSKGIHRILSWLIFCGLLFFIPKKKLPKPDYIIVSSMSLLPVLNVIYYFRKKYPDAKFIMEIRDIWPMTIVELGGYSEKNVFVRFLAWVEKLGYSRADHIVSVLVNANKHIKNVLGHSKFEYSWISNGYHLETSNRTEKINQYLDNNIPKNKFIVGYAGTLGKANSLHYLVHAMQDIPDNVCVCILGFGNERQNLMEMDITKRVIFLDKVPKSQVFPFLQRCDLLYIGLNKVKLFDYGISPQKIFDYMNASRPILLSGEFLDNPVATGKCGFVIPAENIDAIKKSIVSISQMDKRELSILGNSGKDYLIKNFTYDKLAQKYISEVFLNN